MDETKTGFSLRPEQIEVVSDDVAEILRRMTPAERVETVGSMWRCERHRVESLTRSEHPDWDDAKVAVDVARRMTKRAEDEG